ncbi:MAG: hypothetical protein EWM73_00434 [Nitrospira sp.]|nr:MAG: hypothetical protein EWM73_00434 [Nitrospira sp.]
MCLLGEQIELHFDTRSHCPPSLFRPNARTNALPKLPNLQTLIEIAAGENSTTIFPIPIDTIAPFLKGLTKK